MSIENSYLYAILLSSLLPALIIFFVPERRSRLRTFVNLAGAAIKIVLVAILMAGVAAGKNYESRFSILPELDLVLHADAMSLLFIGLSAVLWLLTTIYAIGYLEHATNRSRFFGFFSLCVSSTVGVALAGNLVTFVMFYEMLSISTYPLVVHRGTPEAIRSGRTYLLYTLGSGTILLVAVVWLRSLVGPVEFQVGGMLGDVTETDPATLRWIFAMLIGGLGVKVALVPLHGWLPRAMVAPAPVSALLHAVAVVKAGAFGIVRVYYDVYGLAAVARLGVSFSLAALASVTIVWGSLRALFQDDLKKRLAYSTVSQVSYIVLGVATIGQMATIGGLVHLVHQGFMKITLFFCAGILAETLGVSRISQMNGVGRRMPLTMSAFTVAALGMIGVPPVAGFVSKWYLGVGAIEVGADWVVGVLIASSLLNAMYFLPILYRAWFCEAQGQWPREHSGWKYETHWMLLAPPLVTALISLGAGLFASSGWSPLAWVRLIVTREYAP